MSAQEITPAIERAAADMEENYHCGDHVEYHAPEPCQECDAARVEHAREVGARLLDVEEMAREMFVADSGQNRTWALGIWFHADNDTPVKNYWRRVATALRASILGGAS